MPAPLDPAAGAVALLLKSLRTRAGLDEERLTGTELPLDALLQLDRVRQLVQEGETPQRAIVLAVRTAAGALDPTLSIVADVSLRLRLSADAMPGSDLYANDLGHRRAALLENWGTLHELRSVSPVPAPPTPRALRLDVETSAMNALAGELATATQSEPVPPGPTPPGPGERRGLSGRASSRLSRQMRAFGVDLGKLLRLKGRTAEETARALSVAPAEVIGWAAGKGLPSDQQARELDRYLEADGEFYERAAQLRSGTAAYARAPLRRLAVGQAPLLYHTFQDIAAALRGCLIRDPDGKPQGWPHELRGASGPATAMATAYGVKAMLVLEEHLAPELIPIAEHLRGMASPGGGFATRTQQAGRPEVTAVVLDALHNVEGASSLDDEIAAMVGSIGHFEQNRPYILSTVLESIVKLQPEGPFTKAVAEHLLAARKKYGQRLLWPEKADEGLITPAESPVHTARAVRALALVQAARPSAEIAEAIEQAAEWLVDRPDLAEVSENIERPLGESIEPLYIRHFTAAWVVKALVSVGLPASHPTVSTALGRIWRSYSDPAALWTWRNGDVPIWMTFDAIDAVRMAALAITIPAGTTTAG
jgi:hypothetical protein